MNDKQINKFLRSQFTKIGWITVAYYLLMNVLASLGMVLEMAKQSIWSFAVGDLSMDLDMDAIMGNAWGYILTILVAVVLLHAWKGPGYWKEEILAKESPITPGKLLCLLSFCIGAQMVNTLWVTLLEVILNQFGMSAMTLLENVSGASDTVSMFLYAAILAPIGEEILFRGYILRSLQPYGKRFAIFGSALLFGLFHGNLLQTPYAVLMGLVLGYVTVEHSIVWAVLLHMFNNLVLADLLTRLTANLPEMVLGVINLVIFGGFFLISAGILIAKRREVRAYREREWMDRRVLKCFFTNSGILVLTVIMVINMILVMFA